MGTRADFYSRINGGPETWLGSISMDGYPGGVLGADPDFINPSNFIFYRPDAIHSEWRRKVQEFIRSRRDGITPERWPWPWEDSRTTDYSYAPLPSGEIAISAFGGPWFIYRPEAVNGGEPMEYDEDGEIIDVIPRLDPRADVDRLGLPSHPYMKGYVREPEGPYAYGWCDVCEAPCDAGEDGRGACTASSAHDAYSGPSGNQSHEERLAGVSS